MTSGENTPNKALHGPKPPHKKAKLPPSGMKEISPTWEDGSNAKAANGTPSTTWNLARARWKATTHTIIANTANSASTRTDGGRNPKSPIHADATN